MPPERTQGNAPKPAQSVRERARAAEQPVQTAATLRAWRDVVRNGLI